VVLKPSYIGVSADSVHYSVAADAINNNVLTADLLKKFSWFFVSGRLIALNSFIIFGLFVDVDLIIYILPLTGFVSLMFIFRLITLKYKPVYIQQIIIFFLITIFSLSIDRFLSHTHYLHSNLITGSFYLIGVLLLVHGNGDAFGTKNPYLAIIFLAATMLVRKEMILFSLIPVLLYLVFNKHKLIQSVRYVLFYLLLGYQWIGYYIYKTVDIEISFDDFFYSGHGKVQDYVFGIFITVLMSVVALLIKNTLSKAYLNKLIYIVYFLMLLTLFLVDFQETVSTILKLFYFSIVKISAWGFYWFVLSLALFYSISHRINIFICHVIISFMVLRIGIYVMYDSITDYGGGDRMLLLIFLIGVYLIFNVIQYDIKIVRKKR